LTQGLEGEFKKIVESSSNTEFIQLEGNDMDEELNKKGKGDGYNAYKEQAIIAAEFAGQNAGKNADKSKTSNVSITVLYSTIPYHSSPLAINLASNTMLRFFGNKKNELRVTNQPLNVDAKSLRTGYMPKFHAFVWISMTFSIFITLALIVMMATFVVAPIEERICSVIAIILRFSIQHFSILNLFLCEFLQAKQLQLMTGTSAGTYWLSFLLWDGGFLMLTFLLMIIWLPVFRATFLIAPDGFCKAI